MQNFYSGFKFNEVYIDGGVSEWNGGVLAIPFDGIYCFNLYNEIWTMKALQSLMCRALGEVFNFT